MRGARGKQRTCDWNWVRVSTVRDFHLWGTDPLSSQRRFSFATPRAKEPTDASGGP